MKLSLTSAQAQLDSLNAQAAALSSAINRAKAAGQTEIDTDQALLDLDTQLAADTQQAIDKLT